MIQNAKRWILAVSTSLIAVAGISNAAWAVGDAGCGLGSMIIDKNAKISQTLALTTNESFFSNLFGITSGTSNCSASTLAKNDIEAEKYAEANYQNLRVDMARGEGESLMAFGQLMGCGDASLAQFGQMTRTHYNEIYAQDDVTPVQMILSIRAQMAKEQALDLGCARAI